MSHQVKLSQLVFEDLDILKKAIAEEGLTIKDHLSGYGVTWQKGEAYSGLRKNQTVMFGISEGSSEPKCGIVKNEDGTYELVGDTWGVRYKQGSLEVLGANLAQRYRLGQIRKVATAKGWSIVEAPTGVLQYGSTSKARIVLQPQLKTVTIGGLV